MLCQYSIMKTWEAITTVLLISSISARADLLDLLGLGKKTTNQPSALSSSLSQDQVAQGLKEDLVTSLEQAVSRLGHDGGFLTNLNVRIPMPEKLRTIESTLRLLKQDKLADDFVET